MPTFDHDNIKIHYEISGDGPPLILIAGMMSDSASWAPLIPLLEPHYQIIRPDNRTTGRTTPWDAPVSIDLYARDCAALIDRLSIGRAHVLGHSMGGMIGMRMARSFPETVKSLTLAATAPKRMERNLALFKALLATRQSNASADTWLRALYPWLFSPALYEVNGAVEQTLAAAMAYPYAQTAPAMAHQLAALEGYTPDPVSDLTCPLQALLGQNDLLVPLEQARDSLGQTTTHVIAGAGHSIHWDQPEAVADRLMAFALDD